MGLQRIDGLGGASPGGAGIPSLGNVGFLLLPEAKDDPGCDHFIRGVWRHHSIKAEVCVFERSAVGLDVFQEFQAEVVQRELGEGDAVAEVFDVEDFVLEAEELLVTVTQVFVDKFLDFRVLENVVLKGGGDVHEGHAGLDAVLEVEVFVEVFGGTEVDELDGVTGTANSVNASEALDDPHRVPVDVVVDEVIAVLEVLAFGDAVRGDEEVNFTLLRHGGDFVAPLGARGEIGEDVVEGGCSQSGAGVAAAADKRDVDAKVFVGPLHK